MSRSPQLDRTRFYSRIYFRTDILQDLLQFECVKECAQCCIERRYYPEKRFGKIGVIILDSEKKEIEDLAQIHNTEIKILPRIGVSDDINETPKVLAYQLMGKDENGDLCPFLDINKRSPHGGFACKIYEDRPLACHAYPLINTNPIELDQDCKFCKECGSADTNLDSEMESLVKIRSEMQTAAPYIWRFATGIGEDKDKKYFEYGWILESSNR